MIFFFPESCLYWNIYRHKFMQNKIFLALTFLSLLLFSSSAPVFAAAGITHKTGTLVYRNGTVYLIKDNQRLGFSSADVFTSYGYTFDMVLPADEADMALPQGANLKFRSNTLVLDTSDGRTMYLIFDDGAHPIPGIMEMLFIKADGRTYYSADLSAYPKANPVGLDLVYVGHPAGSLVDIYGTIYLITQSGRRGFPSAEVFFSHGYDFDTAFPATVLDEKLPEQPAMRYRDGTLVDDNGTIFLVSEGVRYGFKTWSGFLGAGYSPAAVLSGSTAGYQEGQSFN